MKVHQILPERLEALNSGKAETQNLVEGLAMDFHSLLETIFPDLPPYLSFSHPGITKRMADVAKLILIHKEHDGFRVLSKHPADTARGWACYVVGLSEISLKESLSVIKPLSDDKHFGVREWAWLALRPKVALEVEEALQLLEKWTLSPSENIRRFASEITRPRGVWCPIIPLLKNAPWHGEALLNNLRNDPSLYVQKSVGNWLNDAAKSHPEWVKELCTTWQHISPESSTAKICKRALRRVNKVEERQ